MELVKYRFGEITVNFDKMRVPLSGAQRNKRQGQYRYYGAQGVIDYIDDYIFDGTYLLIAEDGENLKSHKQKIAQIVSGQFWVNNHAHVIQCNEKCDLRYLCYLINSMDLTGYITGSAQPKLSQSNLNGIQLFLPSLEEQQNIVSYLYMFDQKISVNERINDNLEQQAQTIFKNHFLSFAGKDLPNNWEVTHLGDVITISTKIFNPAKEPETLLEHYSIPAFDETKFPVYELSSNIKSNKFIIDKDCFMISKLNPTTKRVWKPYCLSDKAVCSTEFIVYKAKKREYTDFLYTLIDSENFSYFMCSHVTGSTGSRQRTIPTDTLQFEFAMPPMEDIFKFTAIVQPIYQQIKVNVVENNTLKQLRDHLLPSLMSGKIDVSDIRFKNIE